MKKQYFCRLCLGQGKFLDETGAEYHCPSCTGNGFPPSVLIGGPQGTCDLIIDTKLVVIPTSNNGITEPASLVVSESVNHD